MTVQREQLEADVLIVGAGPAGLACALHLANLIKKHNEAGGASKSGPQLSAEDIYVLEKGAKLERTSFSGAIMNPKALAELVAGFLKRVRRWIRRSPMTRRCFLPKDRRSGFRSRRRRSRTRATMLCRSVKSRSGSAGWWKPPA